MDKLNKNVGVERGEMTEDNIFKLTFPLRNLHSLKDTKEVRRKIWYLRMGHLNFHNLVFLSVTSPL